MIKVILIICFFFCFSSCSKKPPIHSPNFPDYIEMSVSNLPNWAEIRVAVRFEATVNKKFICTSLSAADGKWKPEYKRKMYSINKSNKKVRIPLLFDGGSYCGYKFEYIGLDIRETDDTSIPSMIFLLKNDTQSKKNSPLLKDKSIHISCSNYNKSCGVESNNNSFRFIKNETKVKKINIHISK